MMKVAVIALLAAPSALAFTPANLRGVWSCEVLSSLKNNAHQNTPFLTGAAAVAPATQQSANKAAGPAVWSDTTDKETRVVVFDEPTNTNDSRSFKGRTYYTAPVKGTTGRQTEEHSFHGLMRTAVDGAFYLDENFWNEECYDLAVWTAYTNIANTAQTGQYTNPTTLSVQQNLLAPVIPRGQYRKTTTLAAAVAATTTTPATPAQQSWYGSCSAQPEGPWEFTLDDADHFTLTVDATDLQLDNFHPGGYTGTTPVRGKNLSPRILSLEKCMRGLPEKSEMCGKLARSQIISDSEKDNACQGTLKCHLKGSSENWGCTNAACCSVQPIAVPTYAPQPYYYPQPQYYQQPYAQYQPYQSNPFQFYGR